MATDEERLTYTQLVDAAGATADALIAAGVEVGDRVALWAPNSVRWVISSFGIYMSGASLVPLNTRFKSEEARYIVATSGAKVLLGANDFLEQDFVATAQGWRCLDGVIDLGSWAPAGGTGAWRDRVAQLGESSVSDIIFTSGTTGAPKGAVLSHGASVRTYESWSDCVGLREDDRYLIIYPFFHTAGLKSGILACVLKGAEIHPFAVFDVDRLMDYVSRHRISMLPGPPTVFQSILDHPRFAEFDLSSLRLAVTGAAVVPVEVVRRMREELRFENVVTGYGLTETTGTVSMCRHDDPPEIVATTVGRPLPGVETKVVDEDGLSLPVDEPGEILVRGFNVYPAEVESIIVRHPAVAQVAVVGLPDERLGEVGWAALILKPGAHFDEEEFLGWCKANMANYKVPRGVKVLESLPLNPSGKVMKFKLREQAVTSS